MGHALIVENDALLNMLLQEMVRALGFSAIGTVSAAEARHAVRKGGFDLLLTDLSLDEDGTGLSLAREARLCNAAMRVVIASGHPVPRELETGIGFLQKPFTVAQLHSALLS